MRGYTDPKDRKSVLAKLTNLGDRAVARLRRNSLVAEMLAIAQLRLSKIDLLMTIDKEIIPKGRWSGILLTRNIRIVYRL